MRGRRGDMPERELERISCVAIIRRRLTRAWFPVMVVFVALAVACGNSNSDRVRQLESELATLTAPTATEVATNTPTTTPTPKPPTATPTPVGPTLILHKGWSCVRSSTSYVRTEGLVTNNSSAPLRTVLAVVIWMTTDGTFITSDETLIEYDPLLPGQSSPFEILSRYNPAMSGGKCNLSFKHLLGGRISAEER